MISDNELNVSTALEVSLFRHMTIRCNRASGDPQGISCGRSPSSTALLDPRLLSAVSWIANADENSDAAAEDAAPTLLVTVVSTVTSFGIVWVPVVVIGLILLTCCWCCYCCKVTTLPPPPMAYLYLTMLFYTLYIRQK